MINESGPRNSEAFEFFSKSVFLYSGLMLLFQFFRFYLFQNLVFTKESFNFFELFQMFLWGLRFDLCVISFLLLPNFTLFLLSLFVLNNKQTKYAFVTGYIFIAVVYVLTLLVYYFNLPFIIKNSSFGIPYWMRWEDYKSLWDLSIYPSYWHFDYISEFHSYQLILLVLFTTLLSLFIGTFPSLKIKKTVPSIVIYLLVMALMARGKIGQHHIRFEDSRFSKNNIINELSLNPLWLIDKSKEQLSQD